MEHTRIYIDQVTGTWGDLNDLVLADIPGEGGAEVVGRLAEGSDSEITDIAMELIENEEATRGRWLVL